MVAQCREDAQENKHHLSEAPGWSSCPLYVGGPPTRVRLYNLRHTCLHHRVYLLTLPCHSRHLITCTLSLSVFLSASGQLPNLSFQ